MSLKQGDTAEISSTSPSSLKSALDGRSQLAVLDVREPMDYVEGHVPGSTLVPRRALERRLPELVPNREARVVLISTTDERGARTAEWLIRLGWRSVTFLEGGMAAWKDGGFETVAATDGIYASAFNVPSKEFGEQVAVEQEPPIVSPEQLADWLETDEEVWVVDVRTPGEYESGTLPTAVNVEGVDLPAYVERVREGNEKLVVHCAGRTRSIVNAATLAKRGVENVYGLEDGTSGWTLAGYDLETDADRRVRADEIAEAPADEQRAFAEEWLEEHDIDRLSVAAFAERRTADDKTVYPIDVRTVAEFEDGHVPGTLGLPGGQAIQRADDYIAVSGAEIVFISRSVVRAAITAYWFAEMGFEDVAVLDGGIDAWTDDGRPLETGSHWKETPGLSRAVERQRSCRPLPSWSTVRERAHLLTPTEIPVSEDSDSERVPNLRVLHVGRSKAYREAHLPGSRWVSRNELDSVVSNAASKILLTCPDGVASVYAAAVLERAGYTDIAALDGGIEAWIDAGRSVAAGDEGLADDPPDVVPSTSEQGVEQMRGYLEWERQLARSDDR